MSPIILRHYIHTQLFNTELVEGYTGLYTAIQGYAIQNYTQLYTCIQGYIGLYTAI